MFKKVESNDEHYLSEADLVNQLPCNVICYVIKSFSKISKVDTGFHTLLVKTCDGLTVPARIFYADMDGFIESGLDVNSLKGVFIEMECTPSIWNGQYTIIVKRVYMIDQGTIKDKDKFLEKVEDVDTLLGQCERAFSSLNVGVLPTVYKINSYPSIYNGALGGYVKFAWTWIYKCMVYSSELGTKFLDVLYHSILVYGKYLDQLKLEDYDSNRTKISLLKTIGGESDEIIELTIDVVQAILGLGKPEHLIANIIVNEFNDTMSISKMFNDWKILTLGGVSSSRDYLLRKY